MYMKYRQAEAVAAIAMASAEKAGSAIGNCAIWQCTGSGPSRSFRAAASYIPGASPWTQAEILLSYEVPSHAVEHTAPSI